MKEHNYYVYILTNKDNRVLYTGVCKNLRIRVYQHKHKTDFNFFTARYNINKLVYIEQFTDIKDAIAREKQIKAGSRAKKIALIEMENKKWKDLSVE
jgi:putative endonuclease